MVGARMCTKPASPGGGEASRKINQTCPHAGRWPRPQDSVGAGLLYSSPTLQANTWSYDGEIYNTTHGENQWSCPEWYSLNDTSQRRHYVLKFLDRLGDFYWLGTWDAAAQRFVPSSPLLK